MKQLHRLIVTSQAYQQASLMRPAASTVDPENQLLWRMPLRRMDAETLRDSILSVTGQMDHAMEGSPVAVKTGSDGQVVYGPEGQGERRSIYLLHRRSTPLTLLEAFDAPRMNTNCIERRTSTVVSQALLMLNSEFSENQSALLAEKILASHPDQSADQLTAAYQAILGRVPTAEEYQLGLDFLENQRQRYGSSPDGAGSKSSTVASSDPALVDLCLVLLNSAEFLYVD